MFFIKPKIYTLTDLKDALKEKDDKTSFSNILSKIQFGFKEVEHLCFWDPDNYCKISIEKGEDCELVLICWENGQQSPIHNHELKEAITYVMKGEITEEIYDETKAELEKTVILKNKDISKITEDEKKTHRLINSYNGRSVSLHIYKK
jgi:cysteine dioxygenase